MEVFREMYIQASGLEQIDALMAEVEKALPTGWVRDRILEGYVKDISSRRVLCFSYDGDDRLPRATICLIEDEPGRLRLSSIIPRKEYQLTEGESTALLEEFTERMLRPHAKDHGIHVTSTVQNDLRQWLSNAAVSRFRRFSDGANRRAGYLLPADRERWLEFLTTAHREGSKLDASTLRRWLIEVEGWSPEIADQLASQYAFGGELLTFSESHRAGA